MWDFVIAIPKEDDSGKSGCCGGGGGGGPDKGPRSRRDVEDYLHAAGLTTSTIMARDQTQYLVRIKASVERLERHAHWMKYLMPTRVPRDDGANEELWGDYAPFVSAAADPKKRMLFPPEFNTYQRQEVVRDIIEERPLRYPGKYPGYDRGAGLSLSELVGSNVISQAYALHDPPVRAELIRLWVKKIFSPQPLDLVREYLGEKIALYFAFIGFYTTWLILPTIFGIIVYGLQVRIIDTNSIVTPIFTLLMMIWATVMLEFWKRHQSSLAHQWNTLNFEESEVARPEFRGERMYGFYVQGGGWISVEDDVIDLGGGQMVDRFGRTPAPENLFSPPTSKKIKFAVALPVLAVFLMIVIVVSLAILQLRLVMLDNAGTGKLLPFDWSASGLNAALNAVCIIILNKIYVVVANKLTDWENHRTETEYQDALITKTFLFQFINSYFTMFYIAFFKSKYPLCIFGACRIDTCVDSSCFYELQNQMLIIFGVKALALQAVEVLLPLVKYWITRQVDAHRVSQSLKAGVVPPKKPSQAEFEGLKPNYPGTFDDYNELVIQFGYVILFVAAFPLAPLLAFASNFIEIRMDAFKILVLSQRPTLGKAQDIGTWFPILEIMAVVGVVTNSFVLAFTSDSFATSNGLSITQRMWFAFIAEHSVLLLKFVIAYLIPDTPAFVLREIAKKEWIKDCQFEGLDRPTGGDAGSPAQAAHSASSDAVDEGDEFEDVW
eukprot:TRINITY_DN4523_c0_g1_i1.p1 TRINITY_DN4523_c0_g1~~TRINITY_DN4523_c0_g1_i1.p1  ORF type:complete len:721 (-),score=185.11 TRINITY_DN4523_c0_g1_i1:896-3058(-)